MKSLLTGLNLARCDMLKAILESRGIRCMIKNEYSAMEAGSTFARPELWVVDDAQFEQARAVLCEYEATHGAMEDLTALALAGNEGATSPEEIKRRSRRFKIIAAVGMVAIALGVVWVAMSLRHASAEYYFARGFAYCERGDYQRAIEAYSEAIRLASNYWQAYSNRGSAKVNKGDIEAAIADYNRAIELNPKDPVGYFNRGYAEQSTGDLDGAISDYTRAIELDPKMVGAYVNRADAKDRKGDPDGAIADFSRVIELDPKDILAYSWRGYCRQEKGDLDGAIADYSRAIELDPKNFYAYASRGYAKSMKGDLDGAIADYNPAIERNPKDANTHANRGDVYFMQRNWTNALADYRQCCELNPREQDYPRLGIWLVRVRLGEMEQANKELAAYIDKPPKYAPDVWPAKIAEFLLDRSSESDVFAAAASPDAKKERGRRCEAWFYAGMKRLLAGDKTGAADCFRKCMATDMKDSIDYRLAQAELKALGQ